MASAQRSKASLSGSRRKFWRAEIRCRLLNARKRRCRVHHDLPRLAIEPFGLLNARKRRCRVHDRLREALDPSLQHCSTLESVVVGFTLHILPPDLDSGSCSTLESVVVGFTVGPSPPDRWPKAAQRSKASLSGSQGDLVGNRFENFCSTLESVVVGFTRRRRIAGRRRWTAQRSKASLSGSPYSSVLFQNCNMSCSTLESVVVGFTRLRSGSGRRGSLLNARKRRCRVHHEAPSPTAKDLDCSTLESVVVGFTTPRPASGGTVGNLLNARKRRCRVHRASGPRLGR